MKNLFRNRRHLHDQMGAVIYAVDRCIATKGSNKDFVEMPEQLQKMFLKLLTALDVTFREYENFLWDRATQQEKNGKDFKKNLPAHMVKKVDLVRDYVQSTTIDEE